MPHFDDASPIYLQIAEEIRIQILSGDLAEGARLISTTEYATRYYQYFVIGIYYSCSCIFDRQIWRCGDRR